MSENKIEQTLKNFDKALLSLEVNIQKIKIKPKSDDDYDIYRDSTIQRYEYSIELAKKLMSKYIEEIDKKVAGQKLILKKAFEFDLIESDIWFNMIDDRNITSHEYNENLANELLENIFTYVSVLREFYKNISVKIQEL